MPSLFLTLAGINGFLAVGIGAFGAHALRDRLTPELASTFQTGVQYHMFHTLALFGVGLLLLALPQATLPRISRYPLVGGDYAAGWSLLFGRLGLSCLVCGDNSAAILASRMPFGQLGNSTSTFKQKR
jgi:uncharacterized membrane protein YgdD (TMEM256/DUF423 family)